MAGSDDLGLNPSPTSRTLRAFAKNPQGVVTGNDISGLLNVNSHADVNDLDPKFRGSVAAFQTAAKAAGVETSVMSGYRSRDLQQKLYLNYQAAQHGQPIPYPQEGSGGIAAPPGQSYHNSGLAVDMYAKDPKQQQWLVDNAPKYGLYAGANFGDPGHFQAASGKGAGGVTQAGGGGGPNSLGAGVGGSANASASPPTPPPRPSDLGASPPSASPLQGVQTLATLQALFPQHSFSPVDYNPFSVQPKVSTQS